MKKLLLISACVISLTTLAFSKQIIGMLDQAYVTKVEEQVQIALSQLPEGVEISYEGIESTGSFGEAKLRKPILRYLNKPVVSVDGDLLVRMHVNELTLQTKGNIIVSNDEAVITAPIALTLNKETKTPLEFEHWMSFVYHSLNRVEIEIGQGKVLCKSADENITIAELDQFALRLTKEHVGEYNVVLKFQTEQKNLSFPGLSPEMLKQFVESNIANSKELDTSELFALINNFPEVFPNALGNINHRLNGTINFPNENSMQEASKIAKAGGDSKAFEWQASQNYFAEINLEELSDRLSTIGAKLVINFRFENNPRLIFHIESDLSVTSQYDQFLRKVLDYSIVKAFEENDPSKAELAEFYNSNKTEILDLFPQLHTLGKNTLKIDINFELNLADYDILADYNMNYQIEKPGYEFDVVGNFKPIPFKSSREEKFQPEKMTIKVKNYAQFLQDLVELTNRAQKVIVKLNPDFQEIQPEQVQFGIVAVRQFSDNPKSTDADISFTFDYTDPDNVKLGNRSIGPLKK